MWVLSRHEEALPLPAVAIPPGPTVWDECQRRDKCRAGLKGVYVHHPTLGVCTVRCSDWTKEHGGCNLLLGVVPGREQPAPRPLGTTGLRVVQSLGEILEEGPDRATRFVSAAECMLLARWPVTCCRPTRPSSGIAPPATCQPNPPQEPMLTDSATIDVWDRPDTFPDLVPEKPRTRPRKAVKPPECQTVQDAWLTTCRHCLEGRVIQHPVHGQCIILRTRFARPDATTPMLLVEITPDTVVSCFDLASYWVEASTCTLAGPTPA